MRKLTTKLGSIVLLATCVCVSSGQDVAVSIAVAPGGQVDPKSLVVTESVVEISSGDKITWNSSKAGGTYSGGEPASVRVTVPAGPFGGAFNSGVVAIGTAIVSPAAVVAARGTTTIYTVEVLDGAGKVIRTTGAAGPVPATQNAPAIHVRDPARRDGVMKIRGLFVPGEDTGNDGLACVLSADHLDAALSPFDTSGNWAGSTKLATAPGRANLQLEINQAFKNADDDDVSVFFIEAHAGHKASETVPIDEVGVGLNQDTFQKVGPERKLDKDLVRDDDLDEFFRGVRGLKVIILDSCHAAGLFDGRLDLPLPRSIIIGSSQRNETSLGKRFDAVSHWHGVFAAYLIKGLTGDGAGIARADASSDKSVTVKEWFDYATPKSAALAKTHGKEQHAVMDDRRAPAGAKAADVVVFKYTQGSLYSHPDNPPGPMPTPAGTCGCGLDFGDAPPPFPTLLSFNGARHADSSQEWLGPAGVESCEAVSHESDAVDAHDEDGRSNVILRPQVWHVRPFCADLDKHDDGVTFYPLTYVAGMIGSMDVTVGVADASGGRYSGGNADQSLFLNAWIDWNTNGIWEEGSEHVIDGLVVTPSGDSTTVSASFPVPPIGPGDLWARVRLDYGENVGRNDPVPDFESDESLLLTRGLAQYGEVEDYFLGTDFGNLPDPSITPPCLDSHPPFVPPFFPYPTDLSSDGARHLNMGCEGLGWNASREPDADQAASDQDMAPNLSPCLTHDHPPYGEHLTQMIGDDGFNDGAVDEITLVECIPADCGPGSTLHVRHRIRFRVTSTISSRGFGEDGRYDASDPAKRLYFNAWVDMDTDGIFDETYAMVVDPETFGADGRYTQGESFDDLGLDGAPGTGDEGEGDELYSYRDMNGNGAPDVGEPGEPFDDTAGIDSALLITPEYDCFGDICAGLLNEPVWRFRLDYGEDVATPAGEAMFGEVEDYYRGFFFLEDSDGDGVPDIDDNSPYLGNPGQADSDGDGVGDASDMDNDNDGFEDALELALGSDPLSSASTPEHFSVSGSCGDDLDNDGDGAGDANDSGCDSDGDGHGDLFDNCPGVPNPSQADSDGDGVGDDCDICPGYDDHADADHDGTPDGCEQTDVCADWWALGEGVDGPVFAVLAVDEDGAGPQPPVLYVGGSFAQAGGLVANGIARWDGKNWSTLDSGMAGGSFGAPYVFALARFDDDGDGPNPPALYAAGEFTSAGGVGANRIARWDGVTWSALDLGLNADARALAIFDDGAGEALYVGGAFSAAGSTPALAIARWKEGTWSDVGGGVTGGEHGTLVFALLPAASGSVLYAAGDFTFAGGTSAGRIAAWDGSGWTELDGGTNERVFCLANHDDGTGTQLYAGGAFTVAGDAAAGGMARWNGAEWSALPGGDADDWVLSLASINDATPAALHVGGRFTTVGGAAIPFAARWRQGAWSGFGGGVNATVRAQAVAATTTHAWLYLGGDFTAAGALDASRVARWGCNIGDMNCDGRVDGFDIDGFVLLLTEPGDYDDQYPGCDSRQGDVNGDGSVNGFDVDPFVELLTG